jgi:outer membrane immunogenic protein
VQGGYNWQIAPQWVAGVEGDINWLGVDRVRRDLASNAEFGIETDWYATLRARLGYTNGPTLIYLTGGASWVDVTNHANVPATAPSSRSEIAGGWTAGWGIETMLGGNWSSKAEYLYIDAGNQTVPFGAGLATFDNRFHVFRNGLNYRFGGGPAAPALPAHDWTGFYVGVNAGVGVAQVHVEAPPQIGSVDLTDAGFSGGIQAGYNWQFAPKWVAGWEADFGWLGTERRQSNFFTTLIFGVDADWYGTVRARVGRSTGPALLYATGGAAFVRVKNDFAFPPAVVTKTDTLSGWTIGGGIDAVIGNGWIARSEYLYIDAGEQGGLGGIGAQATARFDNRFHVFKLGLNYQFASGKAPTPVVTKY